jgi:hypothetical protein
MFEYTSSNHFRFGYNGTNQFQARTTPDERFTAEFGSIWANCRDWKEANMLAARKIYEQRVGPVTILLSGGMDSEICLRSFLDQKLDIKAVSLRFTDVKQDDELKHIERLKNDLTFKHEYIDLPLLPFLESKEFLRIGDDTKCVSPIIITHLWLADQVEGTPVIAQGEVHLQKEVPEGYVPGVSPYLPSKWHLYESERLCSIYRFFISRNKPAIPGFFQYMPEQFHSFLTNNKILSNLISNKIPGKLGTRTSKNLMSKQFYPEIPMREKLHGWEAVQKIHDDLRAKLAERYSVNDESYKIEVNELINKLSGK